MTAKGGALEGADSVEGSENADLKRKIDIGPEEGQENEKKFKGNDYHEGQTPSASQPAGETIVNTKPNFATFAENQCFNCQQFGHRSKDCPEKKFYESKTCFVCNQKGHTSKFCPSHPQQQANQRPPPYMHHQMGYGQYQPYQPYYPTPMSPVHMQHHAMGMGYAHMGMMGAMNGMHMNSMNMQAGMGAMVQGMQALAVQRSCYNCGGVGHLSKDCPKMHTNARCFKCGDMGHISKECTKTETAQTCFSCGREGHIGKDCPLVTKNCYTCNGTDHLSSACPHNDTLVCYNCGAKGHMSRACPSPRNNNCHNCGQPGHLSYNCPSGPQHPSPTHYPVYGGPYDERAYHQLPHQGYPDYSYSAGKYY